METFSSKDVRFQLFDSIKLKKTLILDRDNTLIRDPKHSASLEKLDFLPGVLDYLKRISRKSVNIVIATNQGGIALGKFSETELTIFHSEMNRLLRDCDINLFGVIYCSHHDLAIEIEQRFCECRKPKPGMFYKAMELTSCSKEDTAMVGDSWRDEGAAKAAQIPFYDAKTSLGWNSAIDWTEDQ